MNIIFGIVLIVLALSVVVLFAALGELSAQVVSSAQGVANRFVQYEDFLSGHSLRDWLQKLQVPQDVSGVLVLSTLCRSCAELVKDEAQFAEAVGHNGLLVVLSSPNETSAQAFLERNHLRETAAIRLHFDLGGYESVTELGINVSPVLAILNHEAEIISAWQVGSTEAIKKVLSLAVGRGGR